MLLELSSTTRVTVMSPTRQRSGPASFVMPKPAVFGHYSGFNHGQTGERG